MLIEFGDAFDFTGADLFSPMPRRTGIPIGVRDLRFIRLKPQPLSFEPGAYRRANFGESWKWMEGF